MLVLSDGLDLPMYEGQERADGMRSTTLTDRVWLGLCALSLTGYVLCSEAVTAFLREVVRLCGKL